MKELIQWLKMLLLKKRLKKYCLTVTSCKDIKSGFMSVAKLDESILYHSDAVSVTNRFFQKEIKLSAIEFVNKFDVDKVVYTWGFQYKNGFFAIPFGSKEILFIHERLYQNITIDNGEMICLNVGDLGDKVIFCFDGTEPIALKIEDAAGEEKHIFRPGRMPSWDKICLHAS